MDDWDEYLHERYQRLGLLGRGAFGEVVLAAERATGRRVAVKSVYARADAEAAAAREARALRAVAGHPHVVPLLGARIPSSNGGGGDDGDGNSSDDGGGNEGGRPGLAAAAAAAAASAAPRAYLAFEPCAADAAQLLDACHAPLPAAVAKALAAGLLEALAACHAAGVAHCDVKPANCLLGFDGRLKLADFGQSGPASLPSNSDGGSGGRCSSGSGTGSELARFAPLGAGDRAAGAALPAGPTRWYRPPELLWGAGSAAGWAVDAWGAGATIAELLGLGPLLPGASDIGQLAATHAALGPLRLDEWPEAAGLPDWGKVRFGGGGDGGGGGGGDGSGGGGDGSSADGAARLAALLPDAPRDALNLVGALLRYAPYRRLTPAAALRHAYFSADPPPAPAAAVAAFAAGALARKRGIDRALGAL